MNRLLSGVVPILLSVSVVATRLPVCQTQSSPNPIVDEYPGEITGTINGTTAIVPIPYHIARSVIPSQFGILTAAYEKLIPGFPKDMFPAEFEGLLDHDVRTGDGIRIPDFQRIALRFPFVDRLNDGYSCFRYTAPQIISFDNAIALLGSTLYGKTFPGVLNPSCNGYAGNKESTYLIAHSAASSSLGYKPAFETRFETVDNIDYSQKLFVNITNQPSFGSNFSVCDNYITLYNSSLTRGPNKSVPVKGTVRVVPPFYPAKATLEAQGFRMDNGFLERNYLPCESLKGYTGTGPGDSG